MQNSLLANRIVKVTHKFGHFIEIASGIFCVIFFASMFGVTLLGVFFRYIMANPFEWTEELARYLMLSMTFLAINIALRREEHITIVFLIQKLPAKISKILYYFVALLIGFFLIILIKQGYLMTTQTLLRTGTLTISMFWPYLFVPLGALLTFVQLIITITKKVSSDLGFICQDIKQ